MARERRLDVWKVATIGPSTAQRARTETLGVTGSCRCTTSKRPASTHRPTRAAVSGPNESRATEPLLSLIHISEPTRRTPISYAVFCLKKKKTNTKNKQNTTH